MHRTKFERVITALTTNGAKIGTIVKNPQYLWPSAKNSDAVMMSVTTSVKMRATEKTKNFSNKTKC